MLLQAVAVDEPSSAPAEESDFQDPGSVPPDPLDSPFVFDLSEQFESLFSPDAGIPDSGPVPGAEDADSATETPPEPEVPAEVRETFDGIAAVHLGPVRRFLCLLSAGSVAAEWMENCAPAAGLVARSARSMGLENLAARLESFEELLRRAGVDGVKTVAGAMRELVLRAAEELRRDLPQALSPETVGDQKDSVILHSLLRQIPEVGRVTIDKLFAAGFSTVDALERADAHQLSKSAGIADHFSERVCDVIREYGLERDARRAIESPEGWLVPLARAVAVLEEHHAGLEKPANSNGDRHKAAARRKAHRKGLQLAALQLNVLLAEMGHIQMVVEIQCLPFEARISRLRAFLSSLAHASAT